MQSSVCEPVAGSTTEFSRCVIDVSMMCCVYSHLHDPSGLGPRWRFVGFLCVWISFGSDLKSTGYGFNVCIIINNLTLLISY